MNEEEFKELFKEFKQSMISRIGFLEKRDKLLSQKVFNVEVENRTVLEQFAEHRMGKISKPEKVPLGSLLNFRSEIDSLKEQNSDITKALNYLIADHKKTKEKIDRMEELKRNLSMSWGIEKSKVTRAIKAKREESERRQSVKEKNARDKINSLPGAMERQKGECRHRACEKNISHYWIKREMPYDKFTYCNKHGVQKGMFRDAMWKHFKVRPQSKGYLNNSEAH